MPGSPKQRGALTGSRTEWTARLNRFASAKTAKQKRAAIEAKLKTNPGGAIRDLLQAWGYSASSRGRKPKNAPSGRSETPARERLENALRNLYGASPTPVPSLYAKLAGRQEASVRDASRIVAAILSEWPEPLLANSAAVGDLKETASLAKFAEAFVRELLSDLSGGRSYEWTSEETESRVFTLVHEERVGVSHFIRDAGEKPGALIVAGARNILIGSRPVDTLREFDKLTTQFVGQGHEGILIFVFDAAIFEAGEGGFERLYNLSLLSTAMMAFAIFDSDAQLSETIIQRKVDWSHWRNLSRRCCVVIRKPPLIDPVTGDIQKHIKLDDFVTRLQLEPGFEKLGELAGFVRFDSAHVLPRLYPAEFGKFESLAGRDLYWDVRVYPSPDQPQGLKVEYYTPPRQTIETTMQLQAASGKESQSQQDETRGRPKSKTKLVEEDLIYIVHRESPGPLYDDAQRAIYMAARGRLNLESGKKHQENLNAAAALRQVGYEVLPISLMLSLFPRCLHAAAHHNREDFRSETEI